MKSTNALSKQNDLERLKSYLPWLLKDASMEDACEFYRDVSSTNELIAELGRRDRFFLLTHLLHRDDAIDPWLYERCREVENDPDGYLDLWAREHYKSSFITFGGSIQAILRDPEITIGIFSHTRPIAKSFLGQIMREFETNESLKALYPDILWQEPRREAPKWSLDEGICVKRKSNPPEMTVEAWGLIDAQPTGKHFRLMIFDDVVDMKSVYTPDQIIRTTKGWELAQHLGVQKGGRSWHIGTRYAHMDTYAQLLEREAVKPRVHPATEDGTFDGKPVFLTELEWAKKTHLPTAAQVRAKNEGQAHLIAQPIKQKNHEGKWYDVVDWFVRNEYLFFPNTIKKDFLDATSRIYDMDINGPMIYQESDLSPEEMTDDYDPAA